MLALSVRQPYAHAIIHMGKTIENRTWAPKYRGPLLIHAGKAMTKADYEDFVEFARASRLGHVPAREDLQRGGIIGSVNLVGIVHNSRSRWFRGPVGWQLSNPLPLPFLPFKGQLTLFRVDSVSE